MSLGACDVAVGTLYERVSLEGACPNNLFPPDDCSPLENV